MSNMKDGTYNGWTNYATWRVNLEIFDGLDPEDMGWVGNGLDDMDGPGLEINDLAVILREYAEELIESTSPEGLARAYALAFMDHVNYREIAQTMLEAYEEGVA